MFRSYPHTIASLLASLLLAQVGFAAVPVLYRQSMYESPVSGGPNDLLLLAGYGLAATDTVVYRALTVAGEVPHPPASLPPDASAETGLAPVVSTADVPYALTVKLPAIMREGASYALWVRTSTGEWSLPVTINDARPLWISPSFVYATRMPGALPRELKIVGRNLQPATGHATHVRLLGPETPAPDLIARHQSPEVLNRYAVRIELPGRLAPGRYRLQVNRDGSHWVELAGDPLIVLSDPTDRPAFAIDDPRFGGCKPDDGQDDTRCLMLAFAAAARAGGGTIEVGPGTWDLIDSRQDGVQGPRGLVVPPGVDLSGAGSGLTRIERHAAWNSPLPAAAFTLRGHSSVSGFTFTDSQQYRISDAAGPFLQLGGNADLSTSPRGHGAPGMDTATGITITHNVFDKPFIAIGTGDLPLERLFITYNVFGAYRSALELSGNKYNVTNQYRIDDAVIVHNRFEPGSSLDVSAKSGAIASELGAGHRIDFSDNTADGAATQFLYATGDAPGWRAGFFWNLTNNVEEALVSANSATCTGDKIGDGEALAFDNNGNTSAFGTITPVAAADGDTLAVSTRLATRQHQRDIPPDYYVGHWIQVVAGPGLGQVRKISGYSTNALTNVTTFQVTPAWDVPPAAGDSQVALGREFWQVLVIGNQVDHGRPPCQKSNRSRLAGGEIVMWAQSADSVIAGNVQHDSDGIFVQESYDFPERPCADCTMGGSFNYFLEILDNVVDGEYDWDVDCSNSGISIGVASAPWGVDPPPTVGFGNSIAHNVIRHADGKSGGAISQSDSWTAGPPPHRWPLSVGLLIYGNSIEDIRGARAAAVCAKSRERVAIAFPEPPIAWHTVLYNNSCRDVATAISMGAVAPVLVCPSPARDSCECPPTRR